MKNRNECRNLRNVDFNTSTTIMSDYIFRGKSQGTEEGLSLNNQIRFSLHPFYLDININSLYKDTDDEISVYAGMVYAFSDNLELDLFYKKRIYTDNNPDSDEVGLYSRYRVACEGPIYVNILSYDLDTHKYHNDFNFMIKLTELSFVLTYGKTNMGSQDDYIEAMVSGPIAGIPIAGRLGKRLTGDKDDYNTVETTIHGIKHY